MKSVSMHVVDCNLALIDNNWTMVLIDIELQFTTIIMGDFTNRSWVYDRVPDQIEARWIAR